MPKLFLLENDPDISFVLDTHLTREGYQVFSFFTIEAMIGALQNAPPDTILLDYYLLQKHDAELLPRTLRTHFQYRGHIFFLSTSVVPPSVMKASLADGMIEKPFDLDEVACRLKAAIPQQGLTR